MLNFLQGYLYPLYHQNYWMGLTSNSSAYPRFSWIDITIRPPGVAGSYKHWGERQGAGCWQCCYLRKQRYTC